MSPFVILGVSGLFCRNYSIFVWKIILANTVDCDQTPHDVASDLGLQCLPMSLLRVSRQEWVNSTVWQPGSSKYTFNLLSMLARRNSSNAQETQKYHLLTRVISTDSEDKLIFSAVLPLALHTKK